MSLQIYDPTTEVKGRSIAYASRPKSLQGLRIGLIDNTKHNSDQILLRVAGILEREHGAKAHVIRKKKSSGAAPSLREPARVCTSADGRDSEERTAPRRRSRGIKNAGLAPQRVEA